MVSYVRTRRRSPTASVLQKADIEARKQSTPLSSGQRALVIGLYLACQPSCQACAEQVSEFGRHVPLRVYASEIYAFSAEIVQPPARTARLA
jgi:hypothetical protein